MKKKVNLFIVSDENDYKDKAKVIIPWSSLPKSVLESLPEFYFHNRVGLDDESELEEETVVFAILKDKVGREHWDDEMFEDTENNILFLW